MIAELSHFALILALCVAVVQGTLPLIGVHIGKNNWIQLAKPAARAQFLLLALAFAGLTWSFIQHDFSIRYVATNSNTHLPFLYLISGVWGAHEGSLLLWALSLSLWTLALTFFSRSIPQEISARAIAVLGLISVGFLLFLVATSNPFDRLIPAPFEGRELNPLLQDPGLAIHPPMLYMGYVGFAVPFAFAIAAMLSGTLDASWARWSRPWTVAAWIFLTLGITLGSWWAYYELGWGGWWFWDPVENASFMPWLVGTALMHSLIVSEKRGALKVWTVLLAIFAFSLSLLGTFLVRSGVLTSVHAFASSPERGVFILVFLGLVIGGALILFALTASKMRTPVSFAGFSRETFLLLNNVLLVAITGFILIGTLAPLVFDALNSVGFNVGKISVGAPYFNQFFTWFGLPMVIALGFGVHSRWKKDNFKRLFNQAIILFFASLGCGLGVILLMPKFKIMAVVGIAVAFWIVFNHLELVKKRLKNSSIKKIPMGFWGMLTAHLGVSVFIIGVVLTSNYSIEKDVSLHVGDSYQLAEYEFKLEKLNNINEANYTATEGIVTVLKNGTRITTLYPQKRNYATGMPMTEAAIDAGITRDLFVALGEPLPNGAWAVRLYHKPFIRWIWFGCLFMALGGLLTLFDKSYWKLAKKAQQSGVVAI